MIRSFNGKAPQIAASAFISEAAYIVGNVEIGEGSGVWPGAVIRADFARIRIGTNTDVEDNAVLHSGTDLEIGDNVIIGHGAIVHCRKVGNSVLIGMHATILNDVEIGDFCIIAAGAVVMERTKIPSRSVVWGVPAEIQGELSEQQIKRLRHHEDAYTALGRQYREQGLAEDSA